MGDAQASQNEHQLWVNLSALSEGNIFAILPQIFQRMISEEPVTLNPEDFIDVILPSDEQWQTKIYYKLVEKQRKTDAEEGEMLMNIPAEEPKLHQWNLISKKKPARCPNIAPEAPSAKRLKITNDKAVKWTVSDIAKAGSLLAQPPLKVTFEDEQEMRRVYTLIYDVFRYKTVLTEALDEISFFKTFPELELTAFHVCLLLYDLYHRCFKKRGNSVSKTATQLFDTAGLLHAEKCLWGQRIKLAAAVARLRIRNGALSLSELLPPHLRDEKIANLSNNSPVTCWVNGKKLKTMDETRKMIEKSLRLRCVHKLEDLGPNNFIFDEACALTVAFHFSLRPDLARSRLVRDHFLVVQDKSFCLGPAMFGKILNDLELTGSVIQTHINSPRTTAYLANLLSRNERIKTLMAFSAGGRKGEFEKYFNQLGMHNILIFSDKLIDTSLDSKQMEEVTAVFATPPNSYSAINDPIDLVCSRGGDLSMLEILTESECSKEGKERVSRILDEQRKTLKFAMSRPQIQLVLYETHSELQAENQEMVNHTLEEINRIAKLHHATLQGKLSIPDNSENAEINNNENKADILSSISEEQILETISVPDSDIFDLCRLPELCPCEGQCMNFKKEGCFLALLQRKELIKFDNKYMIKMAENRGLFGQTSPSSVKNKNIKSKKNTEKTVTPRFNTTKKKLTADDILRIATPTNAFLCHITRAEHGPVCCRCHQDHGSPTCQYRTWWSEASHHLLALKSKLEKDKIIPPNRIKHITRTAIVKGMIPNDHHIDEIVAEMNKKNSIPYFPKLKLSRTCTTAHKVKLDLPVIDMRFRNY